MTVPWEPALDNSSPSQLNGDLIPFLFSCAGDCPVPRLWSPLSVRTELVVSEASQLSLVPPSSVSPLGLLY